MNKLELKLALAVIAMFIFGIGYAVSAPGAPINGWLFPLSLSAWYTWRYLYSMDRL